jgi:hypothetical protein
MTSLKYLPQKLNVPKPTTILYLPQRQNEEIETNGNQSILKLLHFLSVVYNPLLQLAVMKHIITSVVAEKKDIEDGFQVTMYGYQFNAN